ncbi:MAG: hypothetical protein VZS44_10370 [Bacilli bacterium]|nr:hypothetical protein [Bacilli bacterium]
MSEKFVDDKLNVDMTEIRTMLQKLGTNPRFTVEFRRTTSGTNEIVVEINSEGTTMPRTVKKITSLEQFGDLMVEFVKDTSSWI